MLQELLKISEKIMELINVKQKNDQFYFENVITPLFDEYSKVADKYFILFQSYGEPIENLTKTRNEYIKLRIKVTSLAKTYIKRSKNQNICEFFEALQDFFFISPKIRIEEECPTSSRGALFIELASGKADVENFRKIDLLNQSIQLKWEKVVSIYGDLKLQYTLPIGYKA